MATNWTGAGLTAAPEDPANWDNGVPDASTECVIDLSISPRPEEWAVPTYLAKVVLTNAVSGSWFWINARLLGGVSVDTGGISILLGTNGLISFAAASDVRSGTDRGDGNLGTCAVPVAADVKLGVPVDDTTGTYDPPGGGGTYFLLQG